MLSLDSTNPTEDEDLGITILILKKVKLKFWVIRDLLKVLMTLCAEVETKNKVLLSDRGSVHCQGVHMGTA